MGADGLCTIIEDETGEVVFKGNPPPPDVVEGVLGGEGGGADNMTVRVMKGTARVLASPAVAMVRLSSAAIKSVSGNKEQPLPDPVAPAAARPAAPSAAAAAAAAAAPAGMPIRSVSGTMSAMAAAWRSLRLVGGAKAGAGGSGASELVAAGEKAGQVGGGREVRKDGVVWKSVDAHVADVRHLARQVLRSSSSSSSSSSGLGSGCPLPRETRVATLLEYSVQPAAPAVFSRM